MERNYDFMTVMDFNQIILKHIECPICMEFMHPRIFQCANGHAVCDSCRGNIRKCPMCDKTEFVRCLVIERICEDLLYPCTHKHCKFVCSHRDMKQHEKECAFKPHKCPLRRCSKTQLLFPDELYEHVCKDHEAETSNGTFSSSINISNDVHEERIILHSNKMFKFTYNYEENAFKAIAEMLSPQMDTGNFIMKIKIGHDNTIVLQKPTIPHCLRQYDDNTILTDDEQLQLPDSLLKPFLDDVTLTFNVCIDDEEN